MAAEEIPQPVQKMIQNVLSSAFSLNSTLAEGLGSTMESQRFSLEQLTTLSRMLSQMGTLTENGAMGELSDSLQTLLQNIKGYTSDGNSLEPVLLNKTAFQLLDTKTADDLPAALQLLMGQLAAGGGSTQQLSQNQSEALGFLKQLMRQRPFRSPHHTTSAAAMIGGGSIPRPGEVTLSHHGVLFLDELPEFGKASLEALRQPLEDAVVTVSRVHGGSASGRNRQGSGGQDITGGGGEGSVW